jgi:hypothetical protein
MFPFPTPTQISARQFINTFGLPHDTVLAESIDQLKPGMIVRPLDKSTDSNSATLMTMACRIVSIDERGLNLGRLHLPPDQIHVPPRYTERIYLGKDKASQPRIFDGQAIQIHQPQEVERPAKLSFFARIKRAFARV